MPRPLYILCSQAGSEDKATGLLSHFNIYEKITFRKTKIPQIEQQGIVIEAHPLRVVAVWMKLPEDPEDQEYEFELALILPPNLKRIIAHSGTFAFRSGTTQFRIVVNASSLPLFEGPGRFVVESRIRKAGSSDSDWQRQDYPIIVEEDISEEAGSSTT